MTAGGSTSGQDGDLTHGDGETVQLLQNNLLDSGHIPREPGDGSLLGFQSFAFCLGKNSLKRSFPLWSCSADRGSRRVKHKQ